MDYDEDELGVFRNFIQSIILLIIEINDILWCIDLQNIIFFKKSKKKNKYKDNPELMLEEIPIPIESEEDTENRINQDLLPKEEVKE